MASSTANDLTQTKSSPGQVLNSVKDTVASLGEDAKNLVGAGGGDKSAAGQALDKAQQDSSSGLPSAHDVHDDHISDYLRDKYKSKALNPDDEKAKAGNDEQ